MLESLVSEEPLRERRWALLIVALYRCGRQADALRAYQRARVALDDVGLEPGPELVHLEQRVGARDKSLEHQSTSLVVAVPTGDAVLGKGTEVVRPSGTVTFLFTDLEGSTRLWQHDEDAMEVAVARHFEILDEAITRFDGRVLKTMGDGVFAVFSSALAAFRAATTAQRTLVAERWHGGVTLSARMGLHSGEARPRDGDYFGLALSRASRLMGVAHGGQVVMSLATEQLVRDLLPEGIGLLDLGEHRLKDIARPERIFQVTAPDLPVEFPSLRSADIQPTNLAYELSTFVGHASELDEIDELLSVSRVVTLAGPGGSGKTRLAMHLAGRVAERYPDGVWVLELAQVSNEALILSPLAANLGITVRGSDSPEDLEQLVNSYLETRQALLVLDNCEHLVDATARVTHNLVANCPGITVLTTSREALGLPGEVIFPVPPLSLPASDSVDPAAVAAAESVALFCDRAALAGRGFSLTASNAATVAGICRRLDGIPLAIELAAARVRMLSVEQIRDRLDDCFGLLTGGVRTAVSGHQTLRAALDWSHDLLSPAEQAGLRRLGVFPGRFDVDAAVAVMSDEAPGRTGSGTGIVGFEVLSRLVDKSLVVVEEGPGEDVRYRLLEPLRDYANERLKLAGEDDTIRRRHRDFFLGQADRQSEAEGLAVGRRVLTDLPNYRTAFEWSWAHRDTQAALELLVVQFPWWFWAGYPQAIDWLERVLAEGETADHPARVLASLRLALVLHDSDESDREREERLMRDALAMARWLGEPEPIAHASWAFAELQLAWGNIREARSLLEDALALREKSAFVSVSVGATTRWVGSRSPNTTTRSPAPNLHTPPSLLGMMKGAGFCWPLTPLPRSGRSPWLPAIPIEVCVWRRRPSCSARQPWLRAILIMALTSAAETAILAGNRDGPKNCSKNSFGPCETRQASGGPPTPSNWRACSSKENNRPRLPTPSLWQQRYAATPATSEGSDRSQPRFSELSSAWLLPSATIA